MSPGPSSPSTPPSPPSPLTRLLLLNRSSPSTRLLLPTPSSLSSPPILPRPWRRFPRRLKLRLLRRPRSTPLRMLRRSPFRSDRSAPMMLPAMRTAVPSRNRIGIAFVCHSAPVAFLVCGKRGWGTFCFSAALYACCAFQMGGGRRPDIGEDAVRWRADLCLGGVACLSRGGSHAWVSGRSARKCGGHGVRQRTPCKMCGLGYS